MEKKNAGISTVRGDQSMIMLLSVLSFIASASLSFTIAFMLDAGILFSILFGIAFGILVFCCFHIWADEKSFADSGAHTYIIMTGTLSFVAMLLTYVTLNVFPLGDHTVLVVDMHHQYVAFFSLMREKFFSMFSGSSLIYSDRLGLGGSYLSLFAYYLSSPLNIIMLIFPRAALTEAVALTTLLKVTAGGVTFSIFASRVFKRRDFSVVIGGLAYSMISYFICYSWNLMWLDPLVLLPLICLGMHMLVRERRPALYCISLAMCIITNYYIGYMVCLFLVLYYFATEIGDGSRPSKQERLRRFGRFSYGSLLGGGLSAVLAVPAFISLMSTSGAEDAFNRSVASNFNLISLFQRLLYSAYPSTRGDNLPNLYCSILAVLLLVLYLTCDKIPVRKKVAWGGLVGVLALSMSINWLNFAWHGFHFPNDLPYRFSFLMSFAILCIAMQMLDKLSELSPKRVLLSFGILLVFIMLEQWLGDTFTTFDMIFISLGLFAVYSIIIGLQASGRLRPALCYAVLLVFLFAEVTTNASSLIKQLDQSETFTVRERFLNDYSANKQAAEIVNGFGDNMYRSEFVPRKICNDPSLYGYNGMTVFASSNRKSVTTLMSKLGYAANGVNSYLYHNYVPVSDSILGLKYLTLKHMLGTHPQLEYTGKSVKDGSNERYIYQNTKALSKAYMVNNSIVGWNWQTDNPFEVQNSFISQAAGKDPVYSMLDIYAGETAIYDNADSIASGSDAGTASDLSVVDCFNCDVSFTGSFFSMNSQNSAVKPSFTVSRTVERSGLHSVYVDCRAASSISISVNGSTYSSTPSEPNIIDLGYLQPEDIISVSIYTELDSVVGNVFLASLNEDVFNDAIAELQGRQLEVTDYREGRIKGVITNKKSGMMFTSIPYDGGWTVRVDGVKADTFALGDGFLCFAVPEGTHEISMSFFPVGLTPGIIFTALSLLILVILLNKRLNELVLGPVKRRFNKLPAVQTRKYAGEMRMASEEAESRYSRRANGIDEPAFRREKTAPQKESGTESSTRDYVAEGFERVDLNEFITDESSDE